jgi:hypothetical protein
LPRRVIWYNFTDVSEVIAAAIIRAMIAVGGSNHLANIGKHLPENTA